MAEIITIQIQDDRGVLHDFSYPRGGPLPPFAPDGSRIIFEIWSGDGQLISFETEDQEESKCQNG